MEDKTFGREVLEVDGVAQEVFVAETGVTL